MRRECAARRERDPYLAALYRQEAQRICAPEPPRAVPENDRLVLLPILLLLLTEGADMRLILALLYILF